MSVKARLSQAAVERRRQAVLRHVAEAGEARIADLAERFEVSLMTMHRDLDSLVERHMLRKERGWAVAYPMLTMETATRFREGVNTAEKTALCAAAVKYIRPGGTVLVDDSSTVYPLAGELTRAGVETLTVVTNSIGVAHRMARAAPRIDVTLLGGRYHAEFDSCTGPEVTRTLARTRADVLVMSATAVLQGQLYHPMREIAEIKEAMLGSAAEAVLLVDHTKFGKTATYLHGTTSAFRTVITDDAAPVDEVAALRATGARVDVIDPKANV
ncbi:DeoR/GlpR family DNA-binding transcription regulator [Glycomyces halotolerans]